MELNMEVGPKIPDEAKSAGSVNAKLAKPSKGVPKSKGPKRRSENGSYAPSEYAIHNGITRRDN